MDLDSSLGEFSERDWQTTTEGTLRFAMIALGWWTRDEAIPAVQESDLGTTTVVVSGTAEKAREVADEWETVEHALTYEDFHAGEATDAYDAVYICTPNALHLPYVKSAVEFGKAILCEKPMEASVERAEEIVAVSEAAGVPLMIAYRMQTEPAVRRARELIRDGVIGEPALVRGNMSQPLLKMIPDETQWRLNPDLAGYGTSVMDIGLYPLNTSRFILERDPIRVGSLMRSRKDAFDAVPDERAAFQIEFEDDVLGSYTASQNAAQSSYLTITGTDGELSIRPAFFPWTDRGFKLQIDGTAVDIDWEQINQMSEEFDYFADCVLNDRPVEADGRHGLTDMRTIEAIYSAADRGEVVEL